MKKIIIISAIALLLIVAAFIIFVNSDWRDDEKIIKDRFGITLPKSAQILEFKNESKRISGYTFAAKISFDENDLENVKKSLADSWYLQELSSIPPNIGYNISWWDMDKDNVTDYFGSNGIRKCLFLTRRIHKHAFIVKTKDNQNLLFLDYDD